MENSTDVFALISAGDVERFEMKAAIFFSEHVVRGFSCVGSGATSELVLGQPDRAVYEEVASVARCGRNIELAARRATCEKFQRVGNSERTKSA